MTAKKCVENCFEKLFVGISLRIMCNFKSIIDNSLNYMEKLSFLCVWVEVYHRLSTFFPYLNFFLILDFCDTTQIHFYAAQFIDSVSSNQNSLKVFSLKFRLFKRWDKMMKKHRSFYKGENLRKTICLHRNLKYMRFSCAQIRLKEKERKVVWKWNRMRFWKKNEIRSLKHCGYLSLAISSSDCPKFWNCSKWNASQKYKHDQLMNTNTDTNKMFKIRDTLKINITAYIGPCA